MLKKNIALVSVLFLVFLSGCSTKKVFEPKDVSKVWLKQDEGDSYIKTVSSNLALYDNDLLLTQEGKQKFILDDKYRLLGLVNGWIMSSTIDGTLQCVSQDDANITKTFHLKKTIATVNVEKNILAVIFADSEMALYDFNSQELLYKEMGLHAAVVDSRIMKPYFMNDLVLFPTLDGKIVIVHSKLKKRLRTVIVSSEKNFNNIIYLDKFHEKIIAATGTKILSLGEKEICEDYESRVIIHDKNNIYVATKQGEIYSLTSNLELNAKVKFPFAHFLGMISFEDKLYVLEKEGYLIVLEKNLKNYEVYEVEVDEGFTFIKDTTFYNANKNISIK